MLAAARPLLLRQGARTLAAAAPGAAQKLSAAEKKAKPKQIKTFSIYKWVRVSLSLADCQLTRSARAPVLFRTLSSLGPSPRWWIVR